MKRPPRRKPRIQAAPKIRQVYLCEFPKDAQLPEMWKTRPVIILSYRNKLHGAVTVVPTTTQQNDLDPWLVSIDWGLSERTSYAICDKPTTIAVSRLFPPQTPVPRISEHDFNLVLSRVMAWLPSIDN